MIKRSVTIFFALALTAGFCYIAAADATGQSAQVAEIVHITGIVKIKASDSVQWLDAKKGMKVKEGDILKTEADSTAELGFGKGLSSIINVFPNSQLVISKFEPGRIELNNGRVFALIKGLKKGSTFEVRTPTAVTGARGTGWSAGYQNGQTEVDGFEQTVYVAGLDENGNPLGLEDLLEGYKTLVSEGKGPEKFSELSDAEKDAWRKWKRDAIAFLEQYKKENGIDSKTEAMEELESRVKLLDRVDRETSRSDENKRDRRNQVGGGGEGNKVTTAK